jgi:hypothetical protein
MPIPRWIICANGALCLRERSRQFRRQVFEHEVSQDGSPPLTKDGSAMKPAAVIFAVTKPAGAAPWFGCAKYPGQSTFLETLRISELASHSDCVESIRSAS